MVEEVKEVQDHTNHLLKHMMIGLNVHIAVENSTKLQPKDIYHIARRNRKTQHCVLAQQEEDDIVNVNLINNSYLYFIIHTSVTF